MVTDRRRLALRGSRDSRSATSRRPCIERAKHLLLDGMGCALIGAQLPWSRIASSAVLDLENRGRHRGHRHREIHQRTCGGGTERHFHPGLRARRLPPDRAGAQLFAGDSALLSTVSAQPQGHHRCRLSARGDHRLRGRPTGRLHTARLADARPWLALGAGFRHALCGYGIRANCADCRRHSWRMRWGWRAPSRQG